MILALMHIKYNMDLDLEQIINNFARKYPHRMLLADILDHLSSFHHLILSRFYC